MHNSVWTWFALEAYIVTIGAFVLIPFDLQVQNVKQRWFWRGILVGGAVVHPLFLGGLWVLDSTYPTFVTGTGTVFFVAIVVAGLESVVLNSIANRSRPKNEGAS
jgi:hypothetical protein